MTTDFFDWMGDWIEGGRTPPAPQLSAALLQAKGDHDAALVILKGIVGRLGARASERRRRSGAPPVNRDLVQLAECLVSMAEIMGAQRRPLGEALPLLRRALVLHLGATAILPEAMGATPETAPDAGAAVDNNGQAPTIAQRERDRQGHAAEIYCAAHSLFAQQPPSDGGGGEGGGADPNKEASMAVLAAALECFAKAESGRSGESDDESAEGNGDKRKGKGKGKGKKGNGDEAKERGKGTKTKEEGKQTKGAEEKSGVNDGEGKGGEGEDKPSYLGSGTSEACADATFALGLLMEEDGDLEEATRLFETALKIEVALYGPTHVRADQVQRKLDYLKNPVEWAEPNPDDEGASVDSYLSHF